MAIHVLEVVGLLVFYVVILVIGVLASWWKNRAATKANSDESGGRTERIIVARRDIGMLIGGFTMTGSYLMVFESFMDL